MKLLSIEAVSKNLCPNVFNYPEVFNVTIIRTFSQTVWSVFYHEAIVTGIPNGWASTALGPRPYFLRFVRNKNNTFLEFVNFKMP